MIEDIKPPPKKQQPSAYLTETDQGDMVWTVDAYGEACTYCNDGEHPIPLYRAPGVEK